MLIYQCLIECLIKNTENFKLMLAGWLDTCYYPSCSTTANERGEYDFAKLIAA